MDTALRQDQLLVLSAAADVAAKAGLDSPGAYAQVYSLILSYIDPQISIELGSLASQDGVDSSKAAIDMAVRLSGLDDNVKNIAVWLVGAYMVNSGEGAFSSVIREYNRYQGRLRHGVDFTDSELQKASNAVGFLVVDTVIKNSIIPTVKEVGDNDLNGVRDAIYTVDGENALGAPLYLNQGWPGIIMLNKLGETDYVDRLLQLDRSDAVVVDKFTDVQNLLFTWASFEHAYNETRLLGLKLPDLAVALNINKTIDDWTSVTAVGLFKNLMSPTDSIAKDYLYKIADIGAAKFLDMLMSSAAGVPVVSDPSQFDSLAYEFFKGKDSYAVSWVEGDVSAIAMQDDQKGLAYRNALNVFSLLAVEPSNVATGLEGLAIYNPATGNGGVTDEWVKSRYAMMSRVLGVSATPVQDEFTTIVTNYYDALTGLSYTQYSSNSLGESHPNAIMFGGAGADRLEGTDQDDKLFGGAGADILIGGAGRDYLEGGLGNDQLDGGSGADSLVGMQGADTLIGGAGNDYLEGGSGVDTYKFVSGDGADIIQDSDSNGVLQINDVTSFSAKRFAPGGNLWVTDDGKVKFILESSGGGASDLVVLYGNGDQVVIKNFNSGSFGITLQDYDQDAVIEKGKNVIYGDLIPLQYSGPSLDIWGNVITDPGSPSPGRQDLIYDTSANDVVFGMGGADVIVERVGGNDWFDGGAGNDTLLGDVGSNVLVGGQGCDVLFGGADNDFLTGDSVMTIAESLAQSISDGGRGDYLDGGEGDDTLIGSSSNDWLNGGAGNDLISGGAGDDVLMGYASLGPNPVNSTNLGGGRYLGVVGSEWSINTDQTISVLFTDGQSDGPSFDDQDLYDENDTLLGGAGNDRIYGGKGEDWIDGGADNDYALGQDGNDILFGGDGNDTLFGDSNSSEGRADVYGGNDYLDGGAGDDLLIGGAYDDTIYGGSGNDIIDGDSSSIDPTLAGNDYIDAGSGDDSVIGGSGNDTIFGGAGNDSLGGDDPTMLLLQGDDYIDGGDGNDIIDGMGGNDSIYGGNGDDSINAGSGNNFIQGGKGNDAIWAGDGNDTYQFNDGDGIDVVLDQGGANHFVFAASFTPTNITVQEVSGRYLQVGLGSDILYLDSYQKLYNSTFEFSDGSNWNFTQLMGLVKGALVLDESNSYGTAVGGSNNDSITTGQSNDTLIGQMGNDTLRGGSGNDTYRFQKGDGDDLIVDSAHNDDGSVASNIVQFGAGIDVTSVAFSTSYNVDGSQALKATYSGGSVTISGGLYGVISAFQFADGSQLSFSNVMATLSGIDLVQADTVGGVLYGSDQQDNLYGGVGGDQLFGQAGNDQLDGGAGDDSLYGQEGDDSLYGGQGNDTLDGGVGSDTLVGGSGDDLLKGGDGNDFLAGGAGSDVLEGGIGNDSYLFQAGMQRDLIIDSGAETDTLNFDSSINFNDLIAHRVGADLVIESRYTDDGVTVQDYYLNPGKWNVSDMSGQVRSMADFIAQLENIPTSGLAFYERQFQARIQANFALSMADAGYSLGDNGNYSNSTVQKSGYYDLVKSSSTMSSVFVDGDTVPNPNWVSNPTLGAAVLINTLSASTSETRQMAVGTVLVASGAYSDKPTYYSVGGSKAFNYDLSSQIVEQFDSNGELLGWYVYPAIFTHVDKYLTFIRVSDTTTVEHLVVNGSDQGGTVNVAEGNIYHGGAGDDMLVAINDPTRRILSAYDEWGVMLSGGDGNDTLKGSSNEDILAGGSGSNTLLGYDGADTYVVDNASGNDVIADFSVPVYRQNEVLGNTAWNYSDPRATAIDVVALPDGVGMDELSARWGTAVVEGINTKFINQTPGISVDWNTVANWKRGKDMTALMQYTTLDLSWGNGKTVQIVIPHSDQANGDGIEVIRFADGSEISLAQLIDHFSLGAPPDLMTTGMSFDASASPASSSTPIAGGAGADIIRGNGTLQGWQGNDSLTGGLGADLLLGGRGDDTLIGGAGNDTLQGGAGNDMLDGGTGNDVYVYNGYEGQDTIASTGRGQDSILFQNVWDISQLSFHREGNDLIVVVDGDLAQQVRVQGQFATSQPVIARVTAGMGGQELSADQLASLLTPLPINVHDNWVVDSLQGWNGSNFLYGAGGNDYLTANGGVTLMNGGAGNDQYSFYGGEATIVDEQGVDTLTINNGASINDIRSRLSISGSDLVMDFTSTDGGRLSIQNFFLSQGHQIETILDRNGASLTASEIYQALGLPHPADMVDFDNILQDSALQNGSLVGTDLRDLIQGFNGDDTLYGGLGNDRLEGGNGNDTLVGGAGNDQLLGGRGDDTYVFAPGDGQDTIDNSGGGSDRIVLQGMSMAEFGRSFSQVGNDLKIRRIQTGDEITVTDWFSGGDKGVGSFVLDDGVMTAQQLGIGAQGGYYSPVYTDLPESRDFASVSDSAVMSSTINGSSSDDLLIGGQGDDSLYGGAGNDFLVGGDGNDVYAFDTNSGHDTIDNHSNTIGSFDVLSIFEQDARNLWFSQSSDDLVVTILGSDAQVTVKNWFVDDSSRLALIEVRNKGFYANQVDNLVNAMAMFGAPVGGDINLTHDQRNVIDQMLGVGTGAGRPPVS